MTDLELAAFAHEIFELTGETTIAITRFQLDPDFDDDLDDEPLDDCDFDPTPCPYDF